LSEKQLELGRLWDTYNNDPNLTEEQQNAIGEEYKRKYKEYLDLANQSEEHRNYLKEDDSVLGSIA